MATPVAVAPDRRSRSRAGASTLSALARIEGRRLLLRPAVLIGAALSLLAMVKMSWTTAPVLNRDDTAVSGALLVLAAATLLATNAAALRSRRRATDELLDSMPTPARVRTLADLSSVVAVVPLAVLVAGGFWWWRVRGDPVTSPDLFELVTGPVLVLLGGFVGVALARWAPSPTVAPIAVVGLAILEFVVNFSTGGYESGGRVKWLIPLVGQQDSPRELLVRPTGWHLGYLVALVALLGCVGLLRHQTNRQTVTAAGVAVAMVVVTGGFQLRPLNAGQQPDELAARLTSAAQENCQRRGGGTYCAVPGYEPWIDAWASRVEPVLVRVPQRSGPEQLTVRQDISGVSWHFIGSSEPEAADFAMPTTSEVRPGLWWGRGSGEPAFQFGLALGVASLTVGLSPDGVVSPDRQGSCSSAGQGRGVVALWLAGQAGDDNPQYLRREVRRQVDGAASPEVSGFPAEIYFHWRGAQPVGVLHYGLREAAAAVQLLDQPQDEVAALVAQHWDILTDPATTTDQALTLLDLPAASGTTSTVQTQTTDERGPGTTGPDYFTPCP